MVSLKKKNSRLLKESTKEGKARVKAELDKKVLVDQIRALKKHNAQLSKRCREEVKLKLKEHEERKEAQEKVKTLGGRLAFLLNQLQADEESKIVTKEDMKKMEAQIKTLTERNAELAKKLSATGESNRIITEAMRLKSEEITNIEIKYEALKKHAKELEENAGDTLMSEEKRAAEMAESIEPSAEEVRNRGGRGRFYLDPKPTQGLILIKTKRPTAKHLMERQVSFWLLISLFYSLKLRINRLSPFTFFSFSITKTDSTSTPFSLGHRRAPTSRSA